jgi:hypothetical protein
MKMNVRVSNITAALSLVLCVALLMLWVRSYGSGEMLRYGKVFAPGRPLKVRTITFTSAAGRIELAVAKEHIYLENYSAPSEGISYWHEDSPQPSTYQLKMGWQREFLGFGILKDWENRPSITTLVYVITGIPYGVPMKPLGWTESLYRFWLPHWAFVILAAALPLLRSFRWNQRRRRRARGLCVVCGYDLRGSGEKCPECGEVVLGSGGRASVSR